MIDQKSKDIILKIVMQEISKDEISSILPDYYGDNNLMKMYYKVLDLKDSEALQYLNMLPKDNVLNFKEIEKKLLSEEWHTTHEDIVGYFQLMFNTERENISILLNAITNIPDYLRPDDFKYPYIRKLIYAIGAQPEPYNVEALENLVNETTDQQIKDLALHQIEKRKRLGRWEAAKNVL